MGFRGSALHCSPVLQHVVMQLLENSALFS